jgi:hypothetical protein
MEALVAARGGLGFRKERGNDHKSPVPALSFRGFNQVKAAAKATQR